MPRQARNKTSSDSKAISKTPILDNTTLIKKERKKPRFHPGVQAARECKRLEKFTGKIIPKESFSRVLSEILQDHGDGTLMMQSKARRALQEASEEVITELFRAGHVITRVSKREKIMRRDMRALVQIADDTPLATGIIGAYRKHLLKTGQISKDTVKMAKLMTQTSNGSLKKRLRRGMNGVRLPPKPKLSPPVIPPSKVSKSSSKKTSQPPVQKKQEVPPPPPTKKTTAIESNGRKRKASESGVKDSSQTPPVLEVPKPMVIEPKTKASKPVNDNVYDYNAAMEAAIKRRELEPIPKRVRKDNGGLQRNEDFPIIDPYKILRDPSSINDILQHVDFSKGDQRFTDRKGNTVSINYQT